MTLYELTGEYMSLIQMAEEGDFDPEVLADTMEGIEGELEDKADGYAKVIRTLEGDAATIGAEIDRLTAKKRTIENTVKGIKRHLEESMIAMDKKQIKTALFNFSIQKNPPAVVIDNETEIPDGFRVEQAPKIDRAGIKDYLKDHKVGWAHLEQTEGLRIR